MGICERIKSVRINAKLTQQEFADSLGLKRNTVGSYEIGKIEPSDRTISDICRVFHVNEIWLRTGDGEPFAELSREEELAAFAGELIAGADEFKKRLVICLSRLSPEEWALLEGMAQKLAEEQ